MIDAVLNAFLSRQHEEGMALAAESDILALDAIGPHPPQRYVATFACTTLCRTVEGAIVEAQRSRVGIFFASDYLRRSDPYRLLHWLEPSGVFHPNIGAEVPVICLGHLSCGAGLVEIVYQLHDIITFNRYSTGDVMNPVAAAWVRQHADCLPVDRRPLKRWTPSRRDSAGATEVRR
jgi:hypothetical protein